LTNSLLIWARSTETNAMFPGMWNKTLLVEFDKMSSLGFIYHLLWGKTADEYSQSLAQRDARQKALVEGLQAASETLSNAERAKSPA
jgi:hypothetical protein